MVLGVPLDGCEEIPESLCGMRDLEFLQQAAVRQADGNSCLLYTSDAADE